MQPLVVYQQACLQTGMNVPAHTQFNRFAEKVLLLSTGSMQPGDTAAKPKRCRYLDYKASSSLQVVVQDALSFT